MAKPYRDKMGVIPADRFENETDRVVPLKEFMSEEELAAHKADTERLRRFQAEMLAKRKKT